MEVSLPATNVECIRTHVKRARQLRCGKVDKKRVNPLKIMASFPPIKERIEKSTVCKNIEEINKLVGSNQLDGDDAYCFGREKQFALFNALFKHFIGVKQKFCL